MTPRVRQDHSLAIHHTARRQLTTKHLLVVTVGAVLIAWSLLQAALWRWIGIGRIRMETTGTGANTALGAWLRRHRSCLRSFSDCAERCWLTASRRAGEDQLDSCGRQERPGDTPCAVLMYLRRRPPLALLVMSIVIGALFGLLLRADWGRMIFAALWFFCGLSVFVFIKCQRGLPAFSSRLEATCLVAGSSDEVLRRVVLVLREFGVRRPRMNSGKGEAAGTTRFSRDSWGEVITVSVQPREGGVCQLVVKSVPLLPHLDGLGQERAQR